MKADYQAYKRATSVCLLGMALQFTLGLGLLIYSVIAKDHAALSGSYFILAGNIVWISLAVLFDQHRRERVESLESEQLAAASTRGASVFDEGADDLRVAARRLAWMHKVLMPAASLLFAVVLAAIGLWRLRSGRVQLGLDQWEATREAGWAIGLGAGLGVIGFIFARFVSGMAKSRSWANLRAGAAQAVGASLVGVAILVGHLVNFAGPDVVLRWLEVAIPIAMFVLAGEVVLNFLLDLYRPRRPGELPRPAMDSRVLGFVAAPERIAESIGGALNYQFGFDVASSWFYQLLSRWVLALVVLLGLVVWLMTSLEVVEANERGLRVRFGRQVGEPLEPGLYLKLPAPLETIVTFQTETIRRIELGAPTPTVQGAWLWTNEHGVEERFFLVKPSVFESRTDADEASPRAAKDFALAVAEVPLYFRVSNLMKFERLGAPDQREQVLRAVGRREVMKHLATMTVDGVLGRGRVDAQKALTARITGVFTEMDAGVEVLFVGIEGVHPPRETAAGFESVVKSGQQSKGSMELGRSEASAALIRAAGSVEAADRIVAAIEAKDQLNNAGAPAAEIAAKEREIDDLVLAAGGQASAIINEARAARWDAHMAARARAESSAGQVAAFRANPRVYTARVYFRTLSEIFSQSRVFITDDSSTSFWPQIDLKDPEMSGNVFGELRPEESTGERGN